VQDGDRAAFGILYRSHVGWVYGLCLRLSGSADEAEELTQAAFVRTWERLDTYRGESGFRPWLRRLAVNVVLEAARKDDRRMSRVFAVEDPELLGSSPPASLDDRIDLERAIASLPEGARTALVLHDIEGLRHDEISEMTGMAVGTSKAQLHRARQLLRERLTR
jgi:RNA polymerase sigma-70 factor (ECF subfamily)